VSQQVIASALKKIPRILFQVYVFILEVVSKVLIWLGNRSRFEIFLILIGVVLVISSSGGSKSSPTNQSNQHQGVVVLDPNREYTPPKAWNVYTRDDDMSGKEIVFADSQSLNKNNLHWPYGAGISGELTLRKHPRHGKSVLISIDEGQILCPSYDGCSVLIRFDDRPPIRFSAGKPSDGSSTTLFIHGYEQIVKEIKKSRTMRIELPLYQDGNKSWVFDVSDLDF
jgi:hypothetical protein